MGKILITLLQAVMERDWVQNECLSGKMIRKEVYMYVTTEDKQGSVQLFHSYCVLWKI